MMIKTIYFISEVIFLKEISKRCQNNLEKEGVDKEEISKFLDLPSQCLLDLLFNLEKKIDKLASKLLYEGIKPLLTIKETP